MGGYLSLMTRELNIRMVISISSLTGLIQYIPRSGLEKHNRKRDLNYHMRTSSSIGGHQLRGSNPPSWVKFLLPLRGKLRRGGSPSMICGLLVRQSFSKGIVIKSTLPSVVFFLLIFMGVQSMIISDDPRPIYIWEKLLWWRDIALLLESGACVYVKCSSGTPPPFVDEKSLITFSIIKKA